MKINEVEALVGITKKNIRFYEEEGLLHPRRNAENGYRDYSETDVARLQQIKLLRKIDVPLAELKEMLDGDLPLAQGMHRHRIALCHREDSIKEAIGFCDILAEQGGLLNGLDAQQLLDSIRSKEEEGVKFVNVTKKDQKTQRKHSALLGAGLFIGAILFWLGFLVWIFLSEENALPPTPLLVVMIVFTLLAIGGVLFALLQRMKEIKKGEQDAYRNY